MPLPSAEVLECLALNCRRGRYPYRRIGMPQCFLTSSERGEVVPVLVLPQLSESALASYMPGPGNAVGQLADLTNGLVRALARCRWSRSRSVSFLPPPTPRLTAHSGRPIAIEIVFP